MATFDFLNLGGSVSPPPTLSPSGSANKAARPARQLSQSSEEDEEEYQRELRQRKTGLRRKKKPIASDEGDEAAETTRAEDRDDGDDASAYADVHFVPISLGSESDDAAPLMNKATWVDEQLSLREDEFTTEKTVRVFMATWNVNAKKRHNEPDIGSWMLPPDDAEDDDNTDTANADEAQRPCTPADVYAVGFQEIVDLNAANLVVDRSASAPWDQLILATLHKTGKAYKQIASVHLVGLSLSVFVKERYESAVSDVRVGTVGTGIMGVGGNKGAVICRFELFKSSICVVNTHLAAHQNKSNARNRDYHTILRRALLMPPPSAPAGRRKKLYTDTSNKLKLQPWNVEPPPLDEDDEEELDAEEEDLAASVNATAANTATPAGQAKVAAESKREVVTVAGKAFDVGNMKKLMSAGFTSLKKGIQTTIATVSSELEQMQGPTEEMVKEGFRIYEADHIFWIGDLNYRLKVKSMDMVHQLIDSSRFRALLKLDQLHTEKAARHAFVGFTEGRIRFPPTYKYKTGTNEYDKDPKKARFPAYCDRIQWCTNDSNFEQLYYRRAGKLKASDHKPVMALFDVPVKKDILSKKKKLRSELDALAEHPADCAPRIAVDRDVIDVGDVRFEVPVVKRLLVKNVGNSVVVFRCESAGKRSKKGEGAVNLLQPWLNIDPMEGVIHLNSAVELTITLFVDRHCAYLLNTEEESLATPIILRITSRHAAEIQLKGRYMKSCLGSDLPFLLALPHPIRAPANANDGRQLNKDARPNVPFEVFRLVDHIIKAGGTSSKGVFYPPAMVPMEEGGGGVGRSYTQIESTPQVRYLCEQLDTGRAFDQPATASTPAIKLPTHFFVQALLYFLHSLRKPLFFKRGKSSLASPSPASHSVNGGSFSASSASSSSATASGALQSPPFSLTSWCYQSLMDLPSENYRTFTFICAFLREVVKHEDRHGLGPEVLSACAAGSIMQRMPEEPFSDKVNYTPVQILEHFLSSEDFLK